MSEKARKLGEEIEELRRMVPGELMYDYHMTRVHDIWYVVGRDFMSPVNCYEDGERLIMEMRTIAGLRSEAYRAFEQEEQHG